MTCGYTNEAKLCYNPVCLLPCHQCRWHHARTMLIITCTFHHSRPTSSPVRHLSVSLPPSTLLLHPPTWETGTSTWFIMCLSVRLASPVLLWLPPGVIQSSPLLNPTAKSQWFRPPRTISGLLSICHGKACQNHTYRSLSTEPWRLKWSLNVRLKHESDTNKSIATGTQHAIKRSCSAMAAVRHAVIKNNWVKKYWDCSPLNEPLNASTC